MRYCPYYFLRFCFEDFQVSTKIVIFALNVRGKGSLQVLLSFLRATEQRGLNTEVHTSRFSRSQIQMKDTQTMRFVEYGNSKFIRLYYQFFFGIIHYKDKIFVFGDIPIFFKKHTLFIQNKLYFDGRFNSARIITGRLLISIGMNWVNAILLQTDHMKNAVQSRYKKNIIVCNHPSGRQPISVRNTLSENIIIALTSNYVHKNNEILQNISMQEHCSLYVTLDKENRFMKNGTYYIGSITDTTLMRFYKANPILLITSQTESYGLPMVEAMELGLRFVCPNEEYSTQFNSDNKFVYNQGCTVSLNQAIERAIKHINFPVQKEYSWLEFLDYFKNE